MISARINQLPHMPCLRHKPRTRHTSTRVFDTAIPLHHAHLQLLRNIQTQELRLPRDVHISKACVELLQVRNRLLLNALHLKYRYSC